MTTKQAKPSNTTTKPRLVSSNDPAEFGACPKCGKNDGLLNLGREHWVYCREHRMKWLIGKNLFSGWKDENERIWRMNHATLYGCRKIDLRDVFPNNRPKADQLRQRIESNPEALKLLGEYCSSFFKPGLSDKAREAWFRKKNAAFDARGREQTRISLGMTKKDFREFTRRIETENKARAEKLKGQPPRVLAIRLNTVDADHPFACAICDAKAYSEVGPEIFLADADKLVCHDCASEQAPELLHCLCRYRIYVYQKEQEETL